MVSAQALNNTLIRLRFSSLRKQFDSFHEGLEFSRLSAEVSLEPQPVCDGRAERIHSWGSHWLEEMSGARICQAFGVPWGQGWGPSRQAGWVCLAWIPAATWCHFKPSSPHQGVHFTTAAQTAPPPVCESHVLHAPATGIASLLSLRPRPALSGESSAAALVQRAFSYLLASPSLLVPLHLFL